MKCKTCGKNSDSEYCFAHKSRKPLSSSGKGLTSKMSGISYNKAKNVHNNGYIIQREFFLSIWKKRPHRCENCDAYLGSEPLSYMFDHVLEKSKYPDLRYEEENICMLCLDCHSDKTNCKSSDFMKEKIKKVKEIFGK
jgi:hypothetical protein